ncbi:MAG: hypothetical protein WAN66_14090, partial [Limnoraphis robusta]
MKLGIAFDKELVDDCAEFLAQSDWFFCHYQRKKFLELIKEFPCRARIHTLYSPNLRNNQHNHSLTEILDYLESIVPYAEDCEIFNEVIGRRSDFPFAELVREVRLKFPYLNLLYSDYNCFDLIKQNKIKAFIDEFKLDGLACQMHLALISSQWWKFKNLPNLVQRFGRVDISEVAIRVNQPSILNLMDKHSNFSINQLVPFSQFIQKFQYEKLISFCEQSGVKNLYFWGTDLSFNNDKPSIIDK